jgi:hypothetical protein
MSRAAGSILALALGLLAALALASCGGGEDAKLLPGTTARQITANVASVRTLAAEGECASAQDAAQEVGNEVEDLQGIDLKLKEALQAGAERLNEVVLTCPEETTEEETEETLPTTEETTAPGKGAEKPKPGKEKHEATVPPEEKTEKPEPPGKSEETPPKGGTQPEEPTETTPESPSGGVGPGSVGAGSEAGG